MPILTKQLHEIMRIKKMQVPMEEKIRLLRLIDIDPINKNCHTCNYKREAAKRLLSQMVNYEVHMLQQENHAPA